MSFIVLACGLVHADEFQQHVDTVAKPSSSRKAKKRALAALPLDKLSRLDRAKVQTVLKSISVFRELPAVRFPAKPEAYAFFAKHPDVAVSIWRVMKISQFQMSQTGPHNYEVNGQDGTAGIVDIAYSSPGEYLMLCEGRFKSPVTIRPIKAYAVIHLQTKFSTDEAGQAIATQRACFFASFPSLAVGTAVRLISPVSNAIVDRNLSETSLFVHMMSIAMTRHPGWVERIADQMDGVLDTSRDELLNVTARLYIAEQKRAMAKIVGADQVTLKAVMAPLDRQEPDSNAATPVSSARPAAARN
jgi:hypothetical protein